MRYSKLDIAVTPDSAQVLWRYSGKEREERWSIKINLYADGQIIAIYREF